MAPYYDTTGSQTESSGAGLEGRPGPFVGANRERNGLHIVN